MDNKKCGKSDACKGVTGVDDSRYFDTQNVDADINGLNKNKALKKSY